MNKTILSLFLVFFISAGAAGGSEFGSIEIHGFISQGYMKSNENNFLADTKDGTFQYNDMGINFVSWLTDSLHVGMQFFSRDLGNIGNDEIIVDWSYADYHFQNWLGIRVGKLKSPMGLYNETRDFDMLRCNILLPQGVYNEGWRDSLSSLKGLGIYGTISAHRLGKLNYQVQAGVRNMDVGGGVAKFVDGQADASSTGFKQDTNYVADIKWETPLKGLRLGTSINWIDYVHYLVSNDGDYWQEKSIEALLKGAGLTASEFENRYGAPPTYTLVQTMGADLVGVNMEYPLELFYWTLSVEYVFYDLTLAAEYGRNDVELSVIAPQPFGVLMEADYYFEGFYWGASYRISESFETGLYYSVFFPEAHDKNGIDKAAYYGFPEAMNWSRDLCISTRYDVNSSWMIKLEGHIVDGLAIMYIQDQPENLDGTYDVDEHWFMIALKTTYVF